ncbi:hypothetical protein L7F22_067219 [Adiantum nelumboides]|nr:hypothetical protein [Adiantum nelumboides]
MDAAAHMLALDGAAGALKDPLERSPYPRLSFRSSGLAGKAVSGASTSSSRWHCAARSRVIPRKKENLLAVAEEHFLRAVEHPLEGLTFSTADFAAALSEYDGCLLEVGQTAKGVVFLTDKTGALIDVGAKAPALMPTTEASILNLKTVEEAGLFPGWEDEFHVIGIDDENGRLILSYRKIQHDLAWERCRQLYEEDAIVNCYVLSANRGGLLVKVEGLSGFVPFSLVASKPPFEQWIDKVIPLKFIEVDDENGRLVLSNKKVLMASLPHHGTGSVVEGVVKAVQPYGAFIDIGGRQGLLHISQISHERVTDVNKVFQQGDKLKVLILDDDRKRDKLSLSTRKLEPKPGEMLRNPSVVYELAEKMGALYRKRISNAEAEGAGARELSTSLEGSQSKSGQESPTIALDNLGLG